MENKWGPYYIPFHNNRRNKKTYIFFCYKSYEFLGQSSCDRYHTVALTKTLSFLGRCLVTHKYIRFIKCTSWLAYFILLRIARISKFDKDIYIYIYIQRNNYFFYFASGISYIHFWYDNVHIYLVYVAKKKFYARKWQALSIKRCSYFRPCYGIIPPKPRSTTRSI